MRAVEGAGHRRDGLVAVQTHDQNSARFLRRWQHLDRQFRHHAKCAPGARQKFAEIVAGDVLHHTPTGFIIVAAARNRLESKKMIARGTRFDAARPGEIASDVTAQGALAAVMPQQVREVRRLEGKLLIALGDGVLYLGE